MSQIDKTKAEEIVGDHIRKMMTFRMEQVEDTSNLSCYDIDDFFDYYIFWFSDNAYSLKKDNFVAVNKKDGSVIDFKS